MKRKMTQDQENKDEVLEIYKLEDAIFCEKENKTKVHYFLFDEYEVHYNVIPPKSIQEWHRHTKIEETIFVLSGQFQMKWKQKDEMKIKTVSKNMLIRVKNSIHTLENPFEEEAVFIVFRMVADGKNKREIIKNDKEIISIETTEK